MGWSNVPPSSLSDVQHWSYLNQFYKALREKMIMKGGIHWPPEAQIWDCGIVTSSTITTLTDSTKVAPNDWGTDTWHGNPAWSTAFGFNSFDVIVEQSTSADNPREIRRGQILSNDGNTLTVDKWEPDIPTPGWTPPAGAYYYIVRRFGGGSPSYGLFWSDRILAQPNDLFYANGTVVSATSTTLTSSIATWSKDEYQGKHIVLFHSISGVFDNIYRADVVSNGADGTLVHNLSVTPEAGDKFYITDDVDAYINPDLSPESLFAHYSGVTTSFVTRFPTQDYVDASTLVGKAANTVNRLVYAGPDAGCESHGTDAKDQDVRGALDGPCAYDGFYAPGLFKTIRGLQAACEMLCVGFVERKSYEAEDGIPNFTTNTWYAASHLGQYGGSSGAGWTRQSPAEFRSMYPVTVFIPDVIFNEEGNRIILDPPVDELDQVGRYLTRLPSGGYIDYNSLGVLAENEAFATNDLARYAGYKLEHPTTDDELGPDGFDALTSYKDTYAVGQLRTHENWLLEDPAINPVVGNIADRGCVTGIVDTGSSVMRDYSLTDDSKNWWPNGVMIEHTGTGTSASIDGPFTDTSKSTSAFWGSNNGNRWAGHILEIDIGAGVYQQVPITSYASLTQAITFQDRYTIATGSSDYRIREPQTSTYPQVPLNRWQGRRLLLTVTDVGFLETYETLITHSNDKTIFWYNDPTNVVIGGPSWPALSGTAIYEYQIIEELPGGIWKWSGSKWVKPAVSGYNEREAAPKILTRFGKAEVGDIIGVWIFDELRKGLDSLMCVSDSYVFKATPDPTADAPAPYFYSGSSSTGSVFGGANLGIDFGQILGNMNSPAGFYDMDQPGGDVVATPAGYHASTWHVGDDDDNGSPYALGNTYAGLYGVTFLNANPSVNDIGYHSSGGAQSFWGCYDPPLLNKCLHYSTPYFTANWYIKGQTPIPDADSSGNHVETTSSTFVTGGVTYNTTFIESGYFDDAGTGLIYHKMHQWQSTSHSHGDAQFRGGYFGIGVSFLIPGAPSGSCSGAQTSNVTYSLENKDIGFDTSDYTIVRDYYDWATFKA